MNSKRGKITDENRTEARKLLAIWERTYAERKQAGLHSQGAFGAEYEIGNQAAVGFFLHGHTALSLKAARGFAKGLECKISDFSDRLDKEDKMAWPFELVDREKYEGLSPHAQGAVQMRMMDEINRLSGESESPPSNIEQSRAVA